MRVRNVLFSMIALAAVDGAEVATAQSRETFTVDGIGGIGASGMSGDLGTRIAPGRAMLDHGVEDDQHYGTLIGRTAMRIGCVFLSLALLSPNQVLGEQDEAYERQYRQWIADHLFDDWQYVEIDGDPEDWPSWDRDPGSDVVPDTSSTVDVLFYKFRPDPVLFSRFHSPEFAFLLRFKAAPFQGVEETRVEILFDVVSPDTSYGELTSPWEEFRPDFILGVVGKDGRLVREFHRRYVDGRWETTKGSDIEEIQTALDGMYLEGSLPWDSVGDPLGMEDLDPPDATTGSYFNFKLAFRVSKGDYRDYLPDNSETYFHKRGTPGWKPFGGYTWYCCGTDVDSKSWGQIKSGSSP